MRRRTFVIGTIACCLESALATRAAISQEAKIPRIGVLTSGGPGRSYDAIRQGFAELGYLEGKTIILEPRFARAQSEKLAELAAELV
jgi:putative ABC transport system substrate-binding protein